MSRGCGRVERESIPEVKVLVTGSRDWQDRAAIDAGFDLVGPTLVAHGDALGADSVANAIAMGRGIDVVKFPANWNGRQKSAGMFRNRLMFDMVQPDVVLAFPLPQSIGTIGMMKYAESKGCSVLVCGVDFYLKAA